MSFIYVVFVCARCRLSVAAITYYGELARTLAAHINCVPEARNSVPSQVSWSPDWQIDICILAHPCTMPAVGPVVFVIILLILVILLLASQC